MVGSAANGIQQGLGAGPGDARSDPQSLIGKAGKCPDDGDDKGQNKDEKAREDHALRLAADNRFVH